MQPVPTQDLNTLTWLNIRDCHAVTKIYVQNTSSSNERQKTAEDIYDP